MLGEWGAFVRRQSASKLVAFLSGTALGAATVLVILVASGATDAKVIKVPEIVAVSANQPCPAVMDNWKPRVVALERKQRAISSALADLVASLITQEIRKTGGDPGDLFCFFNAAGKLSCKPTTQRD